MKPSSRSGRFKKKLITHELLQKEVPEFLSLFYHSLSLFRENKISPAELAVHYILLGLSIRYPGTWAGAYQKDVMIDHQLDMPLPAHIPLEPNISRRIAGMSLGDILNSFALKSTPRSVNRALLNFSSGKYPLEVMFHIPSPLDVLAQQKDGRRCLSLIVKERQMKDYILGERDYLGFCMHDLIHADHFYHSNASYLGQLGLYNLLWKELKSGVFDELLKNEEFQGEFEYIIADMNAYPVHLLKCLKSAITFYSSDEVFNAWASKFKVHQQLLKLNGIEYDQVKEDHHLLNWLSEYLGDKLP